MKKIIEHFKRQKKMNRPGESAKERRILDLDFNASIGVPLSSTQTSLIQHISSTQEPHLFNRKKRQFNTKKTVSSTQKSVTSTQKRRQYNTLVS